MSEVATIPTLDTRRTCVAIVGGGIAGSWVALKLARAGIQSVLVDYAATDRGGVLGSSARSVGAVNTAPFERSDFAGFMEELGLGQVHPASVDLMSTYLREELAELQTHAEFKPIKLGVAVAGGNAGPVLQSLRRCYLAAGGQVLDAWVTRVVVENGVCCGVQYQQADAIGKLLASVVVVASGGYAGLFDGSVKTNNHGTLLGRFLQGGGLATNLEFVFKHGYGKPDLGALTPTEELPGAEIYDDTKEHVEWLERELYEGRGTANHLAAFKHWRNHRERNFYIDLKYQCVYLKVQALNAALAAAPAVDDERIAEAVGALLELAPLAQRAALDAQLQCWVQPRQRIDFAGFNALKPCFPELPVADVFRVRQIAYFSMGGIAHNRCMTNLPNVFVTGEAMHDFGAHRVGGLPWGLYLATGRFIADQVAVLLQQGLQSGGHDFELVHARAHFDPVLLRQIRTDLFRYQEIDLKIGQATRFIAELRAIRRSLLKAGRALDDAVAWTILAEAVIHASLRRTESRGCFYRSDHPLAVERMRSHFSCTGYERDADIVTSRMVRISELPAVLQDSGDASEYLVAVG